MSIDSWVIGLLVSGDRNLLWDHRIVPKLLFPASHFVNMNVFCLGVFLQSVQAKLAADSTLFVAAKRSLFAYQMPFIDPDCPGAKSLGDIHCAILVSGPNAASETID